MKNWCGMTESNSFGLSKPQINSLNRRQLIATAGISAASVVGFSQRTRADESDPDVTIEVPDQQSDGETVIIGSLETDVDALLQVFKPVDERPVYKSMQITAGTTFNDRTINLDDPIPGTQPIRISLYPPQGGQAYDGMEAEVFVSEEVDGAVPLDEIGWGTDPGVQMIEADPDAGFHSPYFLYTPTTIPSAEESVSDSQERPLLVEAQPWGVFDERVEDASRTIEHGWMRTVADTTNCPVLIAPLTLTEGFLGLEPQELTLAHEIEITDPRRERVDLQFIAMIEDAKSRLNSETHTVADQIHYAGGSSAAYFIETIAPLHPEHISVFSFGGNGHAFLPFEELTDDIPVHGDPELTTVPWSIGAANLKELTGEEFNKEAWMDIDQFRWIGAEDQDPDDPDNYIHKRFRDDREVSQVVEEIFGTLQVDDRFETSRDIYDHLDVPATFRKFEGQGHVPDYEYMQEVIEFHQQKINENFELIHIIPQKPPTEVRYGDSLTVTVTAMNNTALDSTTSISLAVNGNEVETTDIHVDSYTTESIELETTFEDTGTFSLSVNETTIGEPVEVTAQDDDPADDEAPADDEVDTEDQPGFGIGQAIAALGGIGYLLQQRLSNDEKPTE